MERKPLFKSLILTTMLLVCASAFAQQDPAASPVDAASLEAAVRRYELPRVEYAPPVLTEPRVSIMDAVRSALAHDPNIRLSEVGINLQRGVVQEISGEFDSILTGNFLFQFTQNELNNVQLTGEREKRQSGREEVERATAKAETQEAILDAMQQVQSCFNTPGCDPGEIDFGSPELENQLSLIQVLIDGAETDVERAALIAQRNELMTSMLALQNARVDEAREEEEKALDRLRKLGSIPTVDQSFFGSVDLRVVKPMRTGVDLGAFLTVSGDGSNFRGKPRATEFGGKGITDLYRGEAGVFFDVPLGRGAGVETTTARERAANIDLDASRMFLQHASARTVFSVALAYWDVVAAEQIVAAFQESSRLQDRLIEVTNVLIEADELPAAERPRILASQANILGTLTSAQRSLHDARVRLAQAMGVRIESESQIPVVTSALPEPLPADDLRAIDAAALAAAALDRRYDLLGSRRLQDSGGVLLRAAVLDLKPIINLNAELKFSGVGEHSSVRLGLNEALFHKWVGPSVKLGLFTEYSLGNNIQEGRLVQAQASHDQRRISAENLGRVIRSNVILSHEALLEAAAQARASADAVRFYNELVEAEVEKLRLGSSTLIDTILTEQRRTDAMLGYISARQQYAQLLAQLRYESGTLVESTPEGNLVEPDNLLRPPAIAAR